MQQQPKFIPLRSSDFFGDNRSARLPVAGTVARDQLREDTYFYTGKIGKADGDRLPFPVTMDVLERGQQRFNIYCSPCHSAAGDGNGMITQRGYRQSPSLHDDRLRQAPLGHFFDVMTNGFGAMPDYSAQVSPSDRWAIAAYIRVLQLTQHASINDVPPELRNQIKAAAAYLPNQQPRSIDGHFLTSPSGQTTPKEKPGEQKPAPGEKEETPQ